MPIVDQAVGFISDHGHWAGPATFFVGLAASILGPNFFIPAGTILVSVGTLVGSGLVPWTVCLWASLGVACGGAISFYLGIWLGPAILMSRALRNRRSVVHKARDLFAVHGQAAVFVGYFSGPLRAVVIVGAGIAGMNALRFHFVNVVAALVWAPAFLAQGAAVGALVPQSPPIKLLLPLLVPLLLAALTALCALIWQRLKRRSRSNKTQ